MVSIRYVPLILEQLFYTYNLPFSIIFFCLCLYWIIGLLGVFDFDIDADVDIEVEGVTSYFHAFLKFLNATEIPIMLVLTFISGIGLVINTFLFSLLPVSGVLMSIGLIIGSFFLACLITKYVTVPFRPIFKAIQHNEEKHIAIEGRIGVIRSRALDHSFGIVEVPHEGNGPTKLRCKLPEYHTVMKKGESVIITEYLMDEKIYLVMPAHEVTENLMEKGPKAKISATLESKEQTIEKEIEL